MRASSRLLNTKQERKKKTTKHKSVDGERSRTLLYSLKEREEQCSILTEGSSNVFSF